MISLYLVCCSELWKDIFRLGQYIFSLVKSDSTILASWATVIGVAGGLCVAIYASRTYKSNNSIRKWELIKGIYDNFVKEGWYDFYEKIKKCDQINLSDPKDEKLLNKTLTGFDALNYFRTQGLLDERAWEYIASEILNFALNNSVWEYMNKIKKPYVEKGFSDDIIPFTGFPDLFDELHDKYKAKCLSQLEKRFNKLSPEEQSSYYNKAKNIPDERLQLKRAVAFCIYDNAQKGRKTNT